MARRPQGLRRSRACSAARAERIPHHPDLNGDRPVPGASYQNFANCLDEAFAFAASTLKDRKTAHASDSANFADWVHGQDAVFANCNGSDDKMPAEAPASHPHGSSRTAPTSRRRQSFIRPTTTAPSSPQAIAADTSSPWHEIARLVAARAMIRRATVGQITELPPAAVAAPGAPYSEDREKPQRAYAELLRQKEPARLAEARDALHAIVADPAMQQYKADAAGLLDFVNLRLDPAAQADVLAARLTAPDRAQTPGRFQQALIDLRYYLYPPDAVNVTSSATHPGSGSPLFAWMQAMRAPAPVQRMTSDFGEPSDPAKAQQQRQQAAAEALAQWHATRSDTWLIAATLECRARRTPPRPS